MYFIIREEIYVCTVCMENERETSGRRVTDMSSFNEILYGGGERGRLSSTRNHLEDGVHGFFLLGYFFMGGALFDRKKS
jgi:hypothetical protein